MTTPSSLRKPFHTLFPCLVLWLALSSLNASLTFTHPKNLFELKRGQILPYKLKESHFEIETIENEEEGTYTYVLYLTASKPRVFVAKPVKNSMSGVDISKRNKYIVENLDGVMYVSKTMKQEIGRSAVLDSDISPNGLVDLVTKLKQANKMGTIKETLPLPQFNLQKWPADIVVSTFLNNRSILKNLSIRTFGAEKGGHVFVKNKAIAHDKAKKLVSNYQAFLMEEIPKLWMPKLTKEITAKRTAYYNTLGNGMTKVMFTSISDIETNLKKKLVPLLKPLVNNGLRYIIEDFYTEQLSPFFNADGLAKFLDREVYRADEMNLVVTALKKFFGTSVPQGFEDKISMGFTEHMVSGRQYYMGKEVVLLLLAKYKDYAEQKLDKIVKKIIKDRAVRSFTNELSENLEEILTNLSAWLKKDYNIELSDINDLTEEGVERVKVTNFLLENLVEKSKPSLTEFAKAYIMETVNYSLISDMMLTHVTASAAASLSSNYLRLSQFKLLLPVIGVAGVKHTPVNYLELFADEERVLLV